MPNTTRQPIAAVSAVLVRCERVLLVQRGRAPNAGFWSFPGGKVHFGERLEEAALRELAEETGITARVRELITVLDVIGHEAGESPYHYLLVVMRCDWLAGEPRAADDADDARWIPLAELRAGHYPLTDSVLPLLERLAAAEQ